MMHFRYNDMRHYVKIPIALIKFIGEFHAEKRDCVLAALRYVCAPGEGWGDMPLEFSRNDEARHLLEDCRAEVVSARSREYAKAEKRGRLLGLAQESALGYSLARAWDAAPHSDAGRRGQDVRASRDGGGKAEPGGGKAEPGGGIGSTGVASPVGAEGAHKERACDSAKLTDNKVVLTIKGN